MFLAFVHTCIFSLSLCSANTNPREVTIRQLLQGECHNQQVCVQGVVVDLFPDETDTRYYHLYLFSQGDLVAVTLDRGLYDKRFLSRLINAYVSITGAVSNQSTGLRRHRNPFLSKTTEIKLLESSPAHSHKPNVLHSVDGLTPEEIRKLGRRTVCGKVMATWNKNSLLVETESCGKIRVLLARAASAPIVGADIQVTGIADTDSVDLILKCATWTSSDSIVRKEAEVLNVSPNDLDSPLAHSRFCKSIVRIVGKVKYASSETSADNPLLIECGRHVVQIDPGGNSSAFKNVEVNATVEITGVGYRVLDSDTPELPFARFKKFLVITRTPDDVRVLRRAPWWTPHRLFSLIGLLSAILVGILIWNKTLRRVIIRRSRQLAAEELAHAESNLKIDERTRLAVELHDSLSQTLTGAAMEIRAASILKGDAPQVMLRHLNTAALTLQSCRDELRNCLWDLRSQALDVHDMTTAIVRTLEPYVNETHLCVRFNVPRNRFSDNTAHVILRIVRELVLNAIRHGDANSVRIAGSLDGNSLNFSVYDDGCGFDPDNRPGLAQGHFGLQGIKERIRAYSGTMTIKSAPGAGTKVNIAIKMPEEADRL